MRDDVDADGTCVRTSTGENCLLPHLFFLFLVYALYALAVIQFNLIVLEGIYGRKEEAQE